MAEEKKNWLGPYIPEGSWIRDIIQQAKLAYYLMLDPRVNPLTKLIPIAALAYLVMPVDISPDFVPVLGQIDDVGILMLGLRFFFEFSPPEVVHEHLKRLAQKIGGNWNVTDNPPPSSPPTEGNVVDGKFREEGKE
jgi:uncharacterized membrane protein YkvA (DUF1232 family)